MNQLQHPGAESEASRKETSHSPAQVVVNHEMVSLARHASNLTQSELAALIKVSQPRLSKLEDGLVTVIDRAALTSLSEVTGYPEPFFSQPGFRAPLGNGFFRKRATIPAKVFLQTEARISIKRIELSKVLRSVDREFHLPSWDVDQFRGGAREAARQLRVALGIPAGPIRNLVKIVEDAGCLVVWFDFGTPKIDGLMIRADDSTPIILLNPNVSLARQRATLAHELGHAVLHKVPTEDMDEEAFEFGSEFMMPEHEIRPSLFPATLERLLQLKMKWRMSVQSILFWAKRLGALKENYYRVLMMKLSQSGWRRFEPFDEEWPREEPTFLAEIISYLTINLRWSREDLQRLLNPNARTFGREYFGVPELAVLPSPPPGVLPFSVVRESGQGHVSNSD